MADHSGKVSALLATMGRLSKVICMHCVWEALHDLPGTVDSLLKLSLCWRWLQQDQPLDQTCVTATLCGFRCAFSDMWHRMRTKSTSSMKLGSRRASCLVFKPLDYMI